MTVPLDARNDIRSMDADGVPRAEIAKKLRVSRNTVAKYADMEDMSPEPPLPERRRRPALEGHETWVESVLEADLGAPRKQRHTAKRVFDRLVDERGYEGSYSTVRRFVLDWRQARSAGGGEGYLELEWPAGTCQADYGNFRAVIAGEELDLKLLAATLPRSNDRQCVAARSQASECMCAGLAEIFERWGRAPRVMVLDNATEADRMVCGEVTESRLFSQFRAHYRFEARYCNPYSGNEKGPVENAVGFLRRNLLVPVPSFGSMEELNRYLAAGCAGLNAASRARDGRPAPEALADDLVEMRALPGVPFDAVRWVPAKADKLGYVTAAGREYVAGPARHGGDPRRPRAQGGRAAQGVRRGAGRAQPGLARAGARRQAAHIRRVDDQEGHAGRPRRRHRPHGRGREAQDPQGDRAGERRVGARGGLRGGAQGRRGRPRPRRRHRRRPRQAHSRGRRGGRGRGRPRGLRRLPEGGGRR